MQDYLIQVLVIYSTLSFYLYPVVCSSEELQYYFRPPAALPLPVYLDKWWGKFTFTGSLILSLANAFTLIRGNMKTGRLGVASGWQIYLRLPAKGDV